MAGGDWGVIGDVPPVSITFLTGEGISGGDIQRILDISPQCHIFLRPYFVPSDQEQNFLNYLNDLKALIAPGNWEFIPEGQRHLQIFNEQNMPHTAPVGHPTDQWEGFGPSVEAMERFNRWFCTAYDELKAVNPTWKIGFSPLTPGNRDAYFRTDPENVPYYMHGPEAAKENPTPEEIRAAIASGPCLEALQRADEYLAHIYVINDAEHQMLELWAGLRFVQYAKFFPKPMDIWINENGIGGDETNWVLWYELLDNYPEVRGTCIWILGHIIRSDGHPAVKELKKYVRSLPPAPTADFAASTTTGPAPLSVQFTDQTPGDVKQWRWEFGDGGRSSEQHPTHAYQDAGAFTVTLKAYGAGGEGVKTEEALIQVESGVPAPVAAFSASPTTGPAPLTVHFSDQSTGQVTAWEWNFGDGNTASGQNPVHTYGAPGTHDVTLTATGPGGSDSKTLAGLVSVSAAPTEPVATFVVSQPAGQIDGWQCDFGDGHTSAERNPQHTYEVAGSYTVSLTASGPGGSATETKADVVIVDREIEVPVEPPEEEVHFDTAEEAIRNKAWNKVTVAYNPDAAFPRYARQHGLGAPLTDETDVQFEGKAYRLQGFVGGVVFAPVGLWDQITHIEW
jgi:PKD repeat protein